MNRFATRIWELEDGRITDFAGTYESYRRSKTARRAAQSAGKPKQAAEKKEPGRKKPKSAEKQAARLEREIASLEARLAAFETRREEFCADYEKLMEIDAEEAALRAQLDALYDEWAELAE